MGYRVLIVDDSDVLRILLREMLESLGHEVVGEADDGGSTLKEFREKAPDLVTLDITLPDKNGLEVLKELQEINGAVNVLIVTGNWRKALEDEALSLGALAVLKKPFEEPQVKEVLEKIGPHMVKK